MTRLYQHPGGHAIDFAANTLTVTDIEGKSVSIPNGAYGLLCLADALESAARGAQGNDGLTMPTKGNGLDATNDQPVKTLTKHTANFIATYARLASTDAGSCVAFVVVALQVALMAWKGLS